MTILKMPALADPTYLHNLRGRYVALGCELAAAELETAADILRKLWGDDAAELLVSSESNVDDCTIIPLVLLDRAGEPLWFNCRDRRDLWTYPGADYISDGNGRPADDMHPDVVGKLAEHLERAYEAAGVHGALDVDEDEFFDPENVHLLVLDIAHALREPPEPA